MRITLRTLAKLIDLMSEEQKDSDLTVEIPTDDGPCECYAAELRIAGENHDGGLDDGHPVIFVHCLSDAEQVRLEDLELIKKTIGLDPAAD